MSKINPKIKIQVGNCISELPKSELPASAAIVGGNYPFFCSSSEPKQIDKYIQEKPAILLGTGGVASVNFGDDRFAYSTDTWGIRSTCAELPIEYLYWKLQQLLPEIDYKGFEGSGLRHLRKNFIRGISFEVSKNRNVSKKIAAILTTIDTAIEKTQELIDKYRKIKTGLMNDLFTRGIGSDGKLRPPRSEAPELYKKTELGWIPKEWSWDYLENLLAPVTSNMRSGPFGSALLKSELVENGIPFLGIDNVFNECFVDSFKRFVTEKKFSELFRYAVRPKDVTITIMGTVGRCAVIPQDIGKALSSKHLWTMTFDEDKYYPELICWQLNYASWVLSWFRRETQGGIMDAIQSKTLKKLKLPLPKIDKQQETDLLLKDGRFIIKSTIVNDVKAAKKAFIDFYSAKGIIRLHDRVEYYAKQLGLTPGKITVKDMTYRWASCGKNNSLQFNWRIMMAPIKIIDYIIVHELCHFNHKNHTDAFWNEMDKVMPDYPERKEWLKNNGARLEL